MRNSTILLLALILFFGGTAIYSSFEFNNYLNSDTIESGELRKLPNGISDKWLSDGTIERNVGKLVLNGSDSENYILDQTLTNTYEFMLDIPTDSVKDLGVNQAVSDRLPHIKNYSLDTEHFFFGTKRIYIFIDKSKLVDTRISTLKTYLSKNPITIYYELETPIIENSYINEFLIEYNQESSEYGKVVETGFKNSVNIIKETA